MKYTDNEINEYETLNDQIKKLTKRRDAIKARFLDSQGGESETYQVVLKDNYREIVAGKSEFDKVLGPDFLRSHGLLKISAFHTVVIVRKIAERVG
jgi:hypothetical protein